MKCSPERKEKKPRLHDSSNISVESSFSKITFRRKGSSTVDSLDVIEENEESFNKLCDSSNHTDNNDSKSLNCHHDGKKKKKRKKKYLDHTESNVINCTDEKLTEGIEEEETHNLYSKKPKLKRKKSIKNDLLNLKDTGDFQSNEINCSMEQNLREKSSTEDYNCSDMRDYSLENEELRSLFSPSIKKLKRKFSKEINVMEQKTSTSSPLFHEKKKKKKTDIDESKYDVDRSMVQLENDINLKDSMDSVPLPYVDDVVKPNVKRNNTNFNNDLKQRVNKVKDEDSCNSNSASFTSSASPFINKIKKKKNKTNVLKIQENPYVNDLNRSSDSEIKNDNLKKNKANFESSQEFQIHKTKQRKSSLNQFDLSGAEETLNPLQDKIKSNAKSIKDAKNDQNNCLTDKLNFSHEKTYSKKLEKKNKKKKLKKKNNIDDIRTQLLKQALNDGKQTKNTSSGDKILKVKKNNSRNGKTALNLESENIKSETPEMFSNKLKHHKKKSKKKPDDIDKLTYMLISKALKKISSKRNKFSQIDKKPTPSCISKESETKMLTTPLVHLKSKKEKHNSFKEKSDNDIEKIQRLLLSDALKQLHTTE